MHTYLSLCLCAEAQERIDECPRSPAHGGLREPKGLDGGANRYAALVRQGCPQRWVGEQRVYGVFIDLCRIYWLCGDVLRERGLV